MPEITTTSPDLFAESAAPAKSLDPIYVHLALIDPDVIAAVEEYPAGQSRTDFLSTCLKIGVLSIRATKGLVDGDAIRTAGDRLLDQLSERLSSYRQLMEENLSGSLARYFDPKSGLFSIRVENLVKDDGDLARTIQTQVNSVQQGVSSTLERFLGENSSFLSLLEPSESNRLLAGMKQTVDGVLQAERAAILEQFSLDSPQSALSRLVRELQSSHGDLTTALGTKVADLVSEFSLDRPDSALSRLVGRVETAQSSISREFSLDNRESALCRMRDEIQGQLEKLTTAQTSFQQEMVGLLSSLNSRKAAEAKSTTHGAVFEEAVGRQLRELGTPAGDIVEDCGYSTGNIRASKVGDFVLVLPPEHAAAGAKIVIEAKESSSYSLKTTLEEADEARRNRGAGVCLFVHSSKTAPAGMEPLSRFGHDVIIVWDQEDPSTDLVFKCGLLTAKTLSLRVAQRSKAEAANFQKIDKAIEAMRKQIEGFSELRTTSETIQNGTVKMLERLRIMRTDLERQVEIFADQVGALKDEAATEEGV